MILKLGRTEIAEQGLNTASLRTSESLPTRGGFSPTRFTTMEWDDWACGSLFRSCQGYCNTSAPEWRRHFLRGLYAHEKSEHSRLRHRGGSVCQWMHYGATNRPPAHGHGATAIEHGCRPRGGICHLGRICP